jgi:hypothetical protein
MWLRHLDEINTLLNLPQEECVLTENYMISDIWAGYNEPSSNQIDLFYEIKETTKSQEEITPQSIFKHFQGTGAKKPSSFQGIQIQINGNQVQTPTLAQSQSQDENHKSDPQVEDKSQPEPIINNRSNPYTGTEMFESYRKSASISKTLEQNHDSKSAGSAFSFNEMSKQTSKTGFVRSGSTNEKSIQLLYNHLSQLPDDQGFTSQLMRSGSSVSIGVKQIPVKRKTQ